MTTIENIIEQEQQEIKNSGSYNDPVNGAVGATSTYHAPQFIEDSDRYAAAEVIIHNALGVDGSNSAAWISNTVVGKNKKKKANKKIQKDVNNKLAEAVGKDIETNGFAVCDHFLPAELVRRIRTECGLFNEEYEASEIWVGKQADVGAHLTVPRYCNLI